MTFLLFCLTVILFNHYCLYIEQISLLFTERRFNQNINIMGVFPLQKVLGKYEVGGTFSSHITNYPNIPLCLFVDDDGWILWCVGAGT